MAQFKQWFYQDLTEDIVIRHCESVMFTGDDKGALVGVRLFDDGEAYSGGGTVTGAVKRSDGGLVALTGTLSGNAASVVIPAAALAYPGPIGVHIVLTQGGSVTTVLKAIYSVDDNSGAAVDPGTIIPNVNDLITAINTAVASIPSDYSALLHTLAPDFSASTAYAVGDYVWYNGTLYRFTANHAAGSWAGTDITAAVIGNDLSIVNLISEYGKNKYDGEPDFTFTATKTVYLKKPLPAGTYTLSAVVTSSPSEGGYSRILINNSGSSYFQIVKEVGRNASTVTVTNPITYLVFRAATTTSTSAGKTVTYSNVQIEEGATATDYEPNSATAIDQIARDMIAQTHDMDIVMSHEIVLVDDLPVNFYAQNVMLWGLSKNIQRLVFRTFRNLDVIRGLNIVRLITNPELDNQNGYINIYTESMKSQTAPGYFAKNLQCIFVRPSAGSGLSKKVMFLGDSLTWNGPMLSKIVEMFESDVMNITSVGTVHTSGNNNGYYHEGRSGWSAYNYVHTASKEASWGTVSNAFFNPSTQRFDFSYYVSDTGIIPDYIMICLGTNDMGRSDITESLTAIINSIHSYNSNIKIGLWTLPALALYPNSIEVDFNTGLEISKQIIAAYDNRTSEKIYLVPAHYVLDVEHDFQSTNEQYDKFNSALTYEKCTDRIHPKASGYYKLAELLYGYIKYFGSLDA